MREAPYYGTMTNEQVAELAERVHGKRELTFEEAIAVCDVLARSGEEDDAANAIYWRKLHGTQPDEGIWAAFFADVYQRLGKDGPGRKVLDVLGTTLINGFHQGPA